MMVMLIIVFMNMVCIDLCDVVSEWCVCCDVWM